MSNKLRMWDSLIYPYFKLLDPDWVGLKSACFYPNFKLLCADRFDLKSAYFAQNSYFANKNI